MVGDKLQQLLVSLALSPEEFADEISVGKSTVYKLLRGDTKKMTLSMAKKINERFPEYSLDFLMAMNKLDKSKSTDVGEEYFEKSKEKEIGYSKEKQIGRPLEVSEGVPYYGKDITSTIVSSFDDIPEVPEYYIDIKPLNDCNAWFTNRGDSMFPKYRSGQMLAVKTINNFETILWGESYLVVTNSQANDLRTVKNVHPHDEEDKVILRASNPNFKGDTVVEKKNILSMHLIKANLDITHM